jgi:hypothetical protein
LLREKKGQEIYPRTIVAMIIIRGCFHSFCAETWVVAEDGEVEGKILLSDEQRRLLFHVWYGVNADVCGMLCQSEQLCMLPYVIQCSNAHF